MGKFFSPTTKGFYDDGIMEPPADAVALTGEQWSAHLAAQSAGKTLVFGAKEITYLNPPPLTAAQKISILEATITPRRMREAVLGIDNGWLVNMNAQIATMRSQS